MPGPYGSSANPVRLDPFQQIIGVHWRSSIFLLVTFGLKLDWTPQGERGIGPGASFVEPFSQAFVTEATPAFRPSQPTVQAWTGSSWGNVASTEVALSDTPDLPGTFSFDAWEVNGTNVPENGQYAPFPRFIAEAGTPPDINLPDADTYTTSLTANGEVVAQIFISEPLVGPFAGEQPLWATFDPVLGQKDTFSMSVADLTAIYRARTYLPIATRISDHSEFATGTLAVLMQKQAAPPTP
ncbi:MAG: hypothetical protein EOS05_10355 [Mesorhizobium sp.]|nr:MAG: hypothetical protein EOS05_10355 [Mesorhizobium sp.]